MTKPKALQRATALLVAHLSKEAAKKTTKRSAEDSLASPPDARTARMAISYLDAFGYLSQELAKWQDINLGDILEAIRRFQSMFGLKKTGKLCLRTIKAMLQPRCGCPDIMRPHQNYQVVRKFAATNLTRWRKTGLTYWVDSYVSGLSKSSQDAIVAQAFKAWTDVANIQITRSNTPTADIIMSAGRGRRDQFDGPSGVLAWCELPDGNDQQLLLKWDLDETWIDDPRNRGILLFNVTTHELGHGLGMEHSKLQNQLMSPYYNPSVALPQDEDIKRLQARYGAPSAAPPLAPTAPGRRRLILDLVVGSTATLDGTPLI